MTTIFKFLLITMLSAIIVFLITELITRELNQEEEKCKITNIGLMLENEEIATSFNDRIRSRVKTERGSFSVYGTHSILNDVNLTMKECSRSYICYKKECWKISK